MEKSLHTNSEYVTKFPDSICNTTSDACSQYTKSVPGPIKHAVLENVDQ